jgi:tetratricopeptide (TPR) repeat protein
LLASFSPRILTSVVRFPKTLLSWALASSFAAANAFAHGDVHDRIVALTKQIADTPTNASLYFQRADLYRTDGDWTNALIDLNHVARLDRSIKRVDYMRGLVQHEANQPQAALAPLDRYLADKPPDAEAYTVRARVLAKLGRHSVAVDDYTTAIKTSSTANPELFIERSASLRAMGKIEEGIRGLDEGIRKLGPLVTLELPAVDLELALKHYDAALARIDAVTARLQRKETWLVRRAEILHSAGREDEARKNYYAALEAINRLPPAHRGTRMMLELEARIRTALAINTPSPTK